jgi:hypothetical protein
MTTTDTQQTAGPKTLGQRITQWIEDPFASVIAGIIAPTFAVAFLLSAMYGLSKIY